MKTCVALVFITALAVQGLTQASDTNPVAKVVQLISDLEAKLTAEGAAEKKTYEEFVEWCEETAKKTEYEIKTANSEVAELKATIEKATSSKSACTTSIDELSGDIATDEADLKSATGIREKEAADFAAEEKELVDTISMIERATSVLEREMAKSGASALQLQNANSIAQAMSVMVQASVFSSADATRLTALVQSSQADKSEVDDEELAAPAGAVYEGHSGGIIETLEGLLEKGEAQLADARKNEMAAKSAYEMLKQSLEDEIKFSTEELNKAKTCVSESTETTAVATGDLSVTTKDLASDTSDLEALHSTCMTKAEDYAAATKSREEEMHALGIAKKAVVEKTAGATSLEYDLDQQSSLSLLQVQRSRLSSRVDLANFEAVRFVRDLARKQGSQALAQLASRMTSAVRFGTAAGDDPFAKIKGLITSMLAKLQAEANKDATQKAYCDKEMGESGAKKDEKTAEIEKLSTKIDSAKTKSAKLKEEASELSKELAELASTTAESSKLRQEEKSEYTANKPEMESGIEGIKIALQVLRDYYATKESGAGTGIIGMLEVCESDFTKTLAEMTTTEETAAMSYEKWMKETAITKTTKEQDVKYKTKEAAALDKAVLELTSDKDGVQTELDAILEYLGKLTGKCVAKPEPYEERKKRRDAEIAGLKEALEILESETALVQRGTTRRTLRGVRPHTTV